MRRITLSRQAEDDLATQLQYLAEQGAYRAGEYLTQRVAIFLNTTLAVFPQVGRHIAERNFWEARVAHTHLIAWYQVTDDELIIIAFWHASQERSRKAKKRRH